MGLKKQLGVSEVFCLATGAMISSGLFILPGMAFAKAGPAVIVSYLVAGTLAVIGLFCVVELTTAMPKAGGDYFFITRSFGPGAGTAAGLLSWFSLSLKSAFALVGMAEFAKLIIPLPGPVLGIGLCLFFVGLNLIGTKEAGRAQTLLVTGLLILMGWFVIKGLPRADVTAFKPFASHGAKAVFATAGFVYVSFGGLLKVASVAEEVKNPSRTLPLGLFLSLAVVTLFYIVIIFITVGTVPGSELAKSLTPITDSAMVFMGKPGVIALSVAAVLAFVSTANAGIMAASRYPLALSRDHLIPAAFGRVNERFKTPHTAILFTGAVMMAVLLLDVEALVKAASSAIILANILAVLSIIVLRESKLQNYRPTFRAPLYPWLQIAGVIGFSWVLFEMGRDTLIFCGPLIVGAIMVYWFFGKIHSTRESALAHLVAGIANKRIRGRLLEGELREIIQERDEIVKDRFDQLVDKAVVLDISASMSRPDFFKEVGEKLSGCLHMSAERVAEMLGERESQTSTIIAPGIAIPHLVMDGDNTFKMAVIRCGEGIDFLPDSEPVNTVFVLAGTMDERNFHLRALTAIAQIVQDPDFDKRWRKASGPEALRDLLLLSARNRH